MNLNQRTKKNTEKLFFLSRFPIVAACVLRWIEFRIFDPSYFKLDQGTTPVHLIIIDEVVLNSFRKII